MLKETFSYVNGILDLMFEDLTTTDKPRTSNALDKSDESFPDMDLTIGPEEAALLQAKGEVSATNSEFCLDSSLTAFCH